LAHARPLQQLAERGQCVGRGGKQARIDDAGARQDFPYRKQRHHDGDPRRLYTQSASHHAAQNLVGTGLNCVEMISAAGPRSFMPPALAMSSASWSCSGIFAPSMLPSVSSFRIVFSYSSAAISAGISYNSAISLTVVSLLARMNISAP